MNMLENNNYCSIITTAKNRVDHFIQIFPSLITQYGLNYEVILVDFGSTDLIGDKMLCEIDKRKIMFSPYLKKIIYVKLEEDIKFNPRKAKNLGASNISSCSEIMAFSDIDTFLSMNYVCHWSSKIVKGESFFASRQQDTMASLPRRIRKEINYGNIIVSKNDFCDINGWDESVSSYGGDDDDFCHRLKLKGLREINPIDHIDARQYSILHGDECRLPLMEDANRPDKEKKFREIFDNKEYKRSVCNFLSKKENVKSFELFCQ